MARAGALRGRLRALAALLLACWCATAPAAQTDVIASLTAEEGVPPGAGVVITAGLADGTVSESVASMLLEWTAMPAQQPTDGTPPPLPPPPLQSTAMSKLPDLEGGWRATVPLDGHGPGSLVRYAVTALDANGIELARRPSSVDTDGQRIYRGYVVGWRDIAAQSAVPALHWFVADPEKARWDDPTPGSVAFDDGHGMRYYDEVEVHREGSERHDGAVQQQNAAIKSKDWPKRKYKVHFINKRFAWAPGAPPVRRISLRSMYQESGLVSYMREALALRVMNDIGVPSQKGVYVRLFQNGVLYGLYLMVDVFDATWLQRMNLPPDTALLKAQHWKYSNLRAPDMRLECPETTPDQDYNPGPGHGRGVGCPMVYQLVNPKPADKWDRSHEGLINSFTMSIENVANRVWYYGVNDSFVKGFWELRVDLAQVVTEMAAQTLILNIDRCTKNHVYAHERVTDRWSVIPMDLEDAFATDSRDSYRDCSAQGNSCKDGYCYLSCPSFNSIYLCDSEHPQDLFERSTYNHLVSAVLKNPSTKAKYVSRLHELVDKYNNDTHSWLEEQVYAIKDLIGDDARADAARWKTGNFDQAVDALIGQIKQRRKQLYAQLT